MFKVARPIDDRDVQTSGALDACEWVALGFEIIDCVYPDWQFRPADFVAAYGLHAALIVGEPRPLTSGLADALARFTVKLSTHGEVVEHVSGRNVLRSPALSLDDLPASTPQYAE